MKWKLRIVAIAVAGLFVTASVSFGQQGRAIRNAGTPADDGASGGSLISVSDDAVSRISVGDDESPPIPGVTLQPSPPPSNWMNGQGANPSCGCTSPACGCGNPACCTPGCTNKACDPCAGMGMGGYYGRRFNGYVTAEYLHVWAKGMGLPPLATTDTPPGQGQLGPGSTAAVLFGGNTVGNTLTPSGRITAGLWLDETETDGFAVRFLAVGGNKSGFTGNSAAFPVLASPFNNVSPIFTGPDANVYSFPGTLAGSLNVNTVSNLYSSDALFRWNIDRDCDYRIDLIGGYQYSLISNGVTVNGFSTALAGPATGTTFDIRDAFSARNSFNGGVIGLQGEAGRGPWTASAIMKVGLGQMHEVVKINGSSTVNDGINPPQVFAGGVFAQPTNIGTYNRNKFAVIPELGLNLNRNLTRNLDFNVGYTFMYWSNVALAGSQINNNINATQLLGGTLAGTAQPNHTFTTTNYYINAINFGLTYHY